MASPSRSAEQNGALVQLRKGVIEFCVLAELRHGPSYGLRLAKDLSTRDVLFANEGTLYPLLARLKKQGWVDVEWQESPAGPPRKYYSITPAGIDALADFLHAWRPFVAQANDVLLRDAEQTAGALVVPAKQEFTTTEAAKILGMSRPTLMRTIKRRGIEFRMVGKHHRIPASSIQKLREFLDEDHMAVIAGLANKYGNVD